MKNVTKGLWMLLFCTVLLVNMAACGKEETPELTPTETGNNPSDASDAGEAYSVTLPDGTVLEFTDTPKRIISMGPNITDILFELGAGDRVKIYSYGRFPGLWILLLFASSQGNFPNDIPQISSPITVVGAVTDFHCVPFYPVLSGTIWQFSIIEENATVCKLFSLFL